MASPMIYKNMSKQDEFIQESVNDNEYPLNEFVTINHDPTNDIYSDSENILSQVEKELGNMGVNRGIWSKGKKFKEEKSWIRSVEKARANIETAKKNRLSRFVLKLNTFYIQCNSNTPSLIANIVANAYARNGYKFSPVAKSGFKRLFDKAYLYKQINDDLILLGRLSVNYIAQYGVPTAINNVTLRFIAAKPTTGTMKAINMNESAGIFDDINIE